MDVDLKEKYRNKAREVYGDSYIKVPVNGVVTPTKHGATVEATLLINEDLLAGQECDECGRNLETNFLFCPQCGISLYMENK